MNGVNYINYSTPVTCAKAVDPEGGQVQIEFAVWPSPTFPWRRWVSPFTPSGTTVCYALPPDAALTEITTPAILKVRAADSTGLYGPEARSYVVVDKTPPPAPTPISGNLRTGQWSNPSAANITFEEGGDSASWQYTVDGGPSTPGASTIALSGVSAGYHNLTVTREDRAGNLSSKSFGFGVGAEPATCSTDGFTTTEMAQLSTEIGSGVTSGEMDPTTAAALNCRPSLIAKGYSAQVSSTSDPVAADPVPDASISTAVGYNAGVMQTLPESRGITALTASASKCSNQPSLISEQKVWGKLIWKFQININRCWDGRRVSNVSTSRSFNISTWGKLQGVSWDGYLDDTKFYYTLNGVSNAAYRYTQIVRWSAGNRLPVFQWDCDAVITGRVYGDGSYRKASQKCA